MGDSTLLQLFLSFVLLLQGQLGMNARRASHIQDITASACNDSVRLAFARSDLLLWTHAARDVNGAKNCDGFMSLGTFIARAARDADWLVLGLGHHVAGALGMAARGTPGPLGWTKRLSFFPNNLNHTLQSAIATRAAWGRPDPASVVVVGTSIPVPGCSRFDAPLSAAEAGLAGSDHRRQVDTPMWRALAWGSNSGLSD